MMGKQEKFAEKRKIMFPSNLFIELRLSAKQTQKMRQWEKEDHSIVPVWFENCERVLFIDQDRFDEWNRKKSKKGTSSPCIKRKARELS